MGYLLLLQGLCDATPLLGMEIQDVGHVLTEMEITWTTENSSIGHWYTGEPGQATRKFTAYNVRETIPDSYRVWYSQVDRTIFAYHRDYLPDQKPAMYKVVRRRSARIIDKKGNSRMIQMIMIDGKIFPNLFLMHWRYIPFNYITRAKDNSYDLIHPIYYEKVYNNIFTLTVHNEDQLEQMHYAAAQFERTTTGMKKLSMMMETPYLWQIANDKGTTKGNGTHYKTYFIPIGIQNIGTERPTVWYTDGLEIISTDHVRDRLNGGNININNYISQWFYYRDTADFKIPLYNVETNTRPPQKPVIDQGSTTHQVTPEPSMMDHVRDGVKHALYDIMSESYTLIMQAVTGMVSVVDYASPTNSLRLLLVLIMSMRYGFTISSVLVGVGSVCLKVVEMTVTDLATN